MPKIKKRNKGKLETNKNWHEHLLNSENKIQWVHNGREGKNRRIFFKNQIKIKWRNKKPMEPKRLSGVLCLENDKQRKKVHFTLHAMEEIKKQRETTMKNFR